MIRGISAGPTRDDGTTGRERKVQRAEGGEVVQQKEAVQRTKEESMMDDDVGGV